MSVSSASHFKVQLLQEDQWRTQAVVDTEEDAIAVLSAMSGTGRKGAPRIVKVTIIQEIVDIGILSE
jgi:hypothetical protein